MDRRESQLQTRVRELEAELARVRHENTLLRQKIDLLSRRIFGKSSEQLSPAQLELVLEIAAAGEKDEAPEEPEPAKPRARRSRKPRLPGDLPVEEKIIDPDEVIATPGQWRRIGQEVSEQLDYEPARFIKRRLIRPTYVHRTDRDRGPLTAPLPPTLQERCLAAPGLLAQVVVAKYCDHLPLYRQEQIFKQRHGVELPRQTLAGWIELVADWLKPVYGHLRDEVFKTGYAQIDETPVRYLAPGNGKTKQGYLWTANRPGVAVAYRWETGRAAACLENLVPVDFTGTLQCDGYSAYDAFAKTRKGIGLAGCWAHARRKFFEARETGSRPTNWFLRQIGHLYRIEAHLREKRCSPRLREVIRTQESRPILQRLKRAGLRLRQNNRHLPQSPLIKAIDYTLGQWAGLEVFVEEGRVDIDNNSVENAIRPTALGKKNWMFIGGAEAGERSAILFTIIENCRRCGIDPSEYLRDILTRLPSMTNRQTHTVTPQAWAKEQKKNDTPPASETGVIEARAAML